MKKWKILLVILSIVLLACGASAYLYTLNIPTTFKIKVEGLRLETTNGTIITNYDWGELERGAFYYMYNGNVILRSLEPKGLLVTWDYQTNTDVSVRIFVWTTGYGDERNEWYVRSQSAMSDYMPLLVKLTVGANAVGDGQLTLSFSINGYS